MMVCGRSCGERAKNILSAYKSRYTQITLYTSHVTHKSRYTQVTLHISHVTYKSRYTQVTLYTSHVTIVVARETFQSKYHSCHVNSYDLSVLCYFLTIHSYQEVNPSKKFFAQRRANNQETQKVFNQDLTNRTYNSRKLFNQSIIVVT